MKIGTAAFARLGALALLLFVLQGADGSAARPTSTGVFEASPRVDSIGLRCHYSGRFQHRVRVDLKVRHSDVKRASRYSSGYLKVRIKVTLRRANRFGLATVRSSGRLRIGARGRLIRHRFHSYLNRRQSRRVLRYVGRRGSCTRRSKPKRKVIADIRISQVLARPGKIAATSANSSSARRLGAGRVVLRRIRAASPPFFRPAITTSTGGTGSSGIEVDTFTKVPIPDVATSNRQSNSVSVLLGTGTGSFARAPGSPLDLGKGTNGEGNPPASLVTGDADSDGKADLMAGIEFGGLLVLPGKGNGAFGPIPAQRMTISPAPRSMAIGDLNGDKNDDLAIAHAATKEELPNNVTALLGDGQGGFSQAPGSPLPGADAPFGIAIGRFTSFAKNDLAVPSFETPGFTAMLGTGTGSFAPGPGSPFPAGDSPGAVAVGDLNGDGNQDVAIANRSSTNISVLNGDGMGGFTPAPGQPLAVGSRPVSLAVTDLNGDGKADLASANMRSNDVSVLIGNGRGGFVPAGGSPYAAGSAPADLAIGDLNGDHRPDMAVADTAGVVSVLLNNG